LRGGDTDVSVPFAGALAKLVSTRAVRLRRDFGQFLRAIKAHALLHREHRQRNDGGLIVADIKLDYGPVRDLLADVIAHTAGLAASQVLQKTIKAVADLMATPNSSGVTAIEVGKVLGLDKSSARRRLIAAASEGHLVNLETKRGRPGKYALSAELPDAAQLLPTPEELHEAIYPSSATPETVLPCHRSQKPEQDQELNGGKSGGNGGGAEHHRATDDATDGTAVPPYATDLPPSVPPLSPCALSENLERWHGGSDSGGRSRGCI
jgi:hypothetical protein